MLCPRKCIRNPNFQEPIMSELFELERTMKCLQESWWLNGAWNLFDEMPQRNIVFQQHNVEQTKLENSRSYCAKTIDYDVVPSSASLGGYGYMDMND
ncbi:hypothetical protein L6452_41319 [Arctium lappa]|uniref:Uncharacterized protein n=1 Tax=Arctium lappa TaxID=4217 RepID=A0ACB8XN77_ARCLA|nr:hypothetical protein L6452_41319 [Arctium lappa]